MVIYAFNESGTSAWPIRVHAEVVLARRSTTRAPASVLDSIGALGATAVSMVLGALAALAVARYSFFGRETISFVVILAIALPGHRDRHGPLHDLSTPRPLGFFTIVVGHATFCIVFVYNNAIARLRRTSQSFEEASADLGADTFQTFRCVTSRPSVRR